MMMRGISSSESGSGVSSGCACSAGRVVVWSAIGGVWFLVVDFSCKKNKNKTPVICANLGTIMVLAGSQTACLATAALGY